MRSGSQILALRESAAVGLMPPPEIDLAQWAEANIRLSSEDSAVRGEFHAWPFQREPMTVMSPSHPCEKVSLKCASQTMKTRLLLNLAAYVIGVDPGPMLFIEPTADDAESLSKDRVDPMVRDTPALRGKVAIAKSRDAGNTIFHKKFTGGHLTIAYATAPSKLAMRPIRYLIFDEVSRYVASAGKEGDPTRIGEKRTTTFWNRKIVYASSPGIEGMCRISEIHEFSDQRAWFVPCPFCGHEQSLVWEGLKFSLHGQPIKCCVKTESGEFAETEVAVPVTDPKYLCSECHCLIGEQHKTAMNDAGRWIAQNPDGKYPGFALNQLVSPVRSWPDIVQEWIEIQGKPEQLKVFANTVLAETWKGGGDAPDWEKLKARGERYRVGSCPAGVLFVTAGVDVQKDRMVADFWGWGRGKQRWHIERQVLVGDVFRPEIWTRLTEEIGHTFRHEHGLDIPVVMAAIDSGFATTQVYEWARQQGTARVMVVKGHDGGPALVGQPSAAEITRSGKRVKTGVRVWPVNVSMAKNEIYGYLRQDAPVAGQPFPPGWVHTPELEDEWYRELCAESWVVRIVKGFRRGEWVKTRDRNEALDTANYARAAAAQVGIDRFNESHWRAWEGAVAPQRTSEPEPEAAREMSRETPQQNPQQQQAATPAPTQPRPPQRGTRRMFSL